LYKVIEYTLKNAEYCIFSAFWLIVINLSGTSFLQAQGDTVTIAPGGYITVKEDNLLYIGMDLLIESVPNSSGYFVDYSTNSGLVVTDDILVQRYMTANRWHNIASPVSNETTAAFSSNTDLIFYYDNSLIQNDWNFGWVWYTSGPLAVFAGYDVYFYDNPVTVTYTATGAETLNTGSYNTSVFITNTDTTPSHNSWNLVCNPYPSPVDWLTEPGWDKSNINDAKYIWDGLDSIYTIFIGGAVPFGLNGGTRFIPSNQGFWVQAEANGNFGINNACRVAVMDASTPDFYKNYLDDYPLVSLIATGNGKSDEAVIRFIPGTTEGFDLNYDATKLFSPSELVPQISLKYQNQYFALNTLPEIYDGLEVPMNFQCGKAGDYKINLSDRSNMDVFIKVWLKDKLLMKMTCLTTDSSYTFYHDPGNSRERFSIYFNPSEDIINNVTPENWFSIYSYKDVITIVKNTINQVTGEIHVYDMLGRPVIIKSLKDENELKFQATLPTGSYIVCIITDTYFKSEQVLIVK
jgi:hypothetical protein